MHFSLESSYTPAGDQPKAIETLMKGLRDGAHEQTLLGVTGSGKTFTIANIVAQWKKPTLVIAHNKTLAAQLAAEYREFSLTMPSTTSCHITTTINRKPTCRSQTPTSRKRR